jgi:hypothetical protein
LIICKPSGTWLIPAQIPQVEPGGQKIFRNALADFIKEISSSGQTITPRLRRYLIPKQV